MNVNNVSLDGWFGLLFAILLVVFVIIVIYFEFFVCGGLNGTMAEIPRYCWWFR